MTSPVAELSNTRTGGEVEEVAAPPSANLMLQEGEEVETVVEVDTEVEDDLLLLLASPDTALSVVDSPELDRSPPSADAFFAVMDLCFTAVGSVSFADTNSSSVAQRERERERETDR